MMLGTLIVPAVVLFWRALLFLALAGSLTSTIYLMMTLVATRRYLRIARSALAAARTSNVGQALQRAFRGIEEGEPGDALRHLRRRAVDQQGPPVGCAAPRSNRALLPHLALGNEAASDSDILGQSYEYLIKKFADLTNKKAGEFYTPRSVVRLMVNILDPREGETIYDPACGTGGMLLEAVHHVRESRRRRPHACGASCSGRRRTSPRPPSRA